MANAEQVSILKRGVDVWNGWRAKNIYVYTDLNEADLNGVNLRGADLRIAHLRRANLFRADLHGANLSGADLSDANLREANLSEANLTKANLKGAMLGNAFVRDANLSETNLLAANLRNANFKRANLSGANLMVADLEGTDLSGANLSKTNLTKSDLSGINLRRADLSGAKLTGTNLARSNLMEARFIETDLTGVNLSQAVVGSTVFAGSDLGQVKGLEGLDHRGPSYISMDTFVLSTGKIPEVFLRGCGLSDADIEYAKLSNPALSTHESMNMLQKLHALRAEQAPQISLLFISYSSANSQFVELVGNQLTQKGIRYWRDMHEKNGQRQKQTAWAISQRSKFLLVLSEQSMKSDWIEQDVQEARKLEKDMGRVVLCPVALDDSWKDSRSPKTIMEQIPEHSILDFSGWKDKSEFDDMLRTLLDRLELF
ncbi:MAG TPA: toll/interleukin-1 receptor domain-containing protein [Anaerolineales bacterium]|nr:toll/interleukin-1 receptor domain-containing protein [Anaerolineales bacterium]